NESTGAILPPTVTPGRWDWAIAWRAVCFDESISVTARGRGYLPRPRAVGRRKMDPNDTPPEVVEAIDEVFQDKPIPAPRMPVQPASVQRPLPEVRASGPGSPGPEPLPRADEIGNEGDTARPGSPFKDYVRELQQEFEEQQENGEILP